MKDFEQGMIRRLERSNEKMGLEIRHLKKEVRSLISDLTLARQQRDQLARDLESLRGHAYEKYSNKRDRL